MPSQTAALQIDIHLSEAEAERAVTGHIPFDMDDKWFIYLEGSQLFFHRSWTGVCVYRADIERHADGSATVKSAEVNRNVAEYNSADDQYDRLLLCYLVERLLAERDVPFPVPSSRVSPLGLFQHHVVGSGNREIVIQPKPHEGKS